MTDSKNYWGFRLGNVAKLLRGNEGGKIKARMGMGSGARPSQA